MKFAVMSRAEDDRKIIRIAVSLDAKKVIGDFADEWDMTEMGVASRLYMWFAAQPEDVQKWVVGMTRGSESYGMKLFAQKLLEAVKALPAAPIPRNVIVTEKGE